MAKIVVVGAGPAGCSAGYHLAKSGHEVTLVDRASFPRDKTCGDAISVGSLSALSMMGIYPPQLTAAAGDGAVFRGLLLGAPNHKTNAFRATLSGYCIPRYAFDQVLYAQAMAAGCRPLLRHVRELSEVADSYDFAIDARGVHAGTANAVAIRTYWEVPIAALGELYDALQIYFDAELNGGYGWIFPVGERAGNMRLNVGVGIWTRTLRGAAAQVGRLLQQFITSNPAASALAQRTVARDRPRGYHLAGAQKGTRVALGNVLRVGDAANLTDPLTGEGIQNALLSGHLVAVAINSSVAASQVPQVWQRLYDDTFDEHLRAGLVLGRLFESRFLVNGLIYAMNRDVRIAERINASIFDLIKYNELLPSLARVLWPRKRGVGV